MRPAAAIQTPATSIASGTSARSIAAAALQSWRASTFAVAAMIRSARSFAASRFAVIVVEALPAGPPDGPAMTPSAPIGRCSLQNPWPELPAALQGEQAVHLGYTREGRYAADHRCCVTGSSSIVMKRLPIGSKIYRYIIPGERVFRWLIGSGRS